VKGIGCIGGKRNRLSLPGLEFRSLCCPARSLVTVATKLSEACPARILVTVAPELSETGSMWQ